jgi:hypothetical protein
MIPVPEMANLFTMPLPKDIRYKFHFRPAYGSNKMLIEIFYGVEKEEFLPDFLDALKSFKPKLERYLAYLQLRRRRLLSIERHVGPGISVERQPSRCRKKNKRPAGR